VFRHQIPSTRRRRTCWTPEGEADAVLVHGDFGPNNALFDPVTFQATAVVDWE
jgi:aminoglycoside phosphotransferase (APT) family kinase protein